MGLNIVKAFLTAMLIMPIGTTFAQDCEEDIIERNQKTYVSETSVPYSENANTTVIPTRPKQEFTPNTMMDSISAEAKMRFMQSMMASNPFSLRDIINLMVVKKQALPELTFDEVIESLQSKALDLNMRQVGHNTPYVILRESFDPDSPRLEIFSFCDLQTMRQILDYSLEFSAFVPCKVTVLEDANKNIWLTTLDWDVRWLDTGPNPNRIPTDLRERAIKVRENIEAIMEAAAVGDF